MMPEGHMVLAHDYLPRAPVSTIPSGPSRVLAPPPPASFLDSPSPSHPSLKAIQQPEAVGAQEGAEDGSWFDAKQGAAVQPVGTVR